MFNKNGMSKSRKLSLLAMALCSTVAMPARAGLKVSSPVFVNITSATYKYASGAIGSARNAGNAVEYIGCQTLAWSSGAATQVICSAKSAGGVFLSCSSTDPQVVNSARAITPTAWIHFTTDGGPYCTHVHTSTSSQYAPPVL